MGAFRTSPMQSLYVEANKPPLYLRFDKLYLYWTVQKPHIDFYLTHQKKHLGDDCLFQSLFAELKSYYTDHRAIYTDGSKTENRVAAAATSDGLSAQVRLPGNASIFTAELQALKMAFNIVKNCDEDRFIIFCDSLSSLQALDSNNCNHPIIQDILELFNDCCSVNK